MKKSVYAIAVVCFIAFAFCSCRTTSGYYLNPVESDGVVQTEVRGKNYEIADSDIGVEYTAYAQPTYDEKEVQVSIGIANLRNEDFYFSDSSVELFRGNHETGKWTSLGRWNAKNYYQNVYNNLKTQEKMTAIAGMLGTIGSAMGTTSTSTIYTPHGNAYVQTRTYSPAMTYATALVASANMDLLISNNRLTLDNLQSSLLFSTNIEAKDSYIGNVYIPTNKSSPDFKVTVSNDDGSTHDFIFARSDRDEVLNPWKDQSRDRHSIVFTYAINGERMQLSWLWSRKRKIGMYAGLSLYNISKMGKDDAPGFYEDWVTRWNNFEFDMDPNPDDDKSSRLDYEAHFNVIERISIGMGMPMGINYRILPNTWLNAGVDVIMDLGTRVRGTIQYKLKDEKEPGKTTDYPGTYWDLASSSSFLKFGLQAGVNIITNFLDFNIGVTYVIPNKVYFDVGGGIAF